MFRENSIDRECAETFYRLYQQAKERAVQTGIATVRQAVPSAAGSSRTGRPAIVHCAIDLNGDVLSGFAESIVNLSASYISEKFHKLADIIQPPASTSALVQLVQRTCRGEGQYLALFSREWNIPVDQIGFFAVYLTRPARQAAAEACPVDLNEWRLGYCPVCGLWPRMARIAAEDNRLWLWCIGCDTQWPFTRLRCPFCLESEPRKLGYLQLDERAGYRINTCESCRRYLKTKLGTAEGRGEQGGIDAVYLLTQELDVTAAFEKYIQDFVGFAAFDLQDNPAAEAYREKIMV